MQSFKAGGCGLGQDSSLHSFVLILLARIGLLSLLVPLQRPLDCCCSGCAVAAIYSTLLCNITYNSAVLAPVVIISYIVLCSPPGAAEGASVVCVLWQPFPLHAITQAVCAWPCAVQQPQGACSHSQCPSQGCASGAACPSSVPSPSAVAACHDGASQSTATDADHMIQGIQALLIASP